MLEKVTLSVAAAVDVAELSAALPDEASAACAAGTAKAERTRAPETAATVARMRMRVPQVEKGTPARWSFRTARRRRRGPSDGGACWLT
jgi:hypothetical protein